MLILRLDQKGRQNKEFGPVLVNHILMKTDVLTRIGEAGTGGNIFNQVGARTGVGLAFVDTADGFGEAVQAKATKGGFDRNQRSVLCYFVLILLDGDFLGKLGRNPDLDLHVANKVPAVKHDVEFFGAEGPDVVVLAGGIRKEGVPRTRGLEGLLDRADLKVVEDSVEVDHQNVLIGGVMGVDIVEKFVAHEGEAHGTGGNSVGLGVEGQNAVTVGIGSSK